MEKVAIILLADTETKEGLGRAIHAMVYAQQLAEKGNQVRLIFDGTGVRWLDKILNDTDSEVSKEFMGLKIGTYTEPVDKFVCKACSVLFGLSEGTAEKLSVNVADQYNAHANIAELTNGGYRVVTL